MATKQCSKCREIKEIADFAMSGRKGKQRPGSQCKACVSEYLKEYHYRKVVSQRPPRECSVCHQLVSLTGYRRSKNGPRDVCIECEKVVVRCCKCKELKPHHRFAPDKELATGLKSQCRDCDRRHEKIVRKTPEFRAKENARRKQPHVRAKVIAYNQAYFATEQGREKVRAYHKTVKGYAARARRRAKRRMVESTLTATEWLEILKEQNGRCYYCGREFDLFLTPEQDHRVPVSKLGPHTKENVVAACGRCNKSKGNRSDRPITLPA